MLKIACVCAYVRSHFRQRMKIMMIMMMMVVVVMMMRILA